MIGIRRRVDNLGRVSLPIDFRRSLGIKELDYVEIYCDGEQIIIKPRKENK